MFDFLKPNPQKRMQKEYEKLTTKAFEAQRNGDIRTYSLLTAEAEDLKKKMDETQ